MIKKRLMLNCLWVIAVPILLGVILASGCGLSEMITVLNPAVTEALSERVPLTGRLDSLEGKTIYLVDMNYEGIGGTPVMRQMQAWFAENMPEVKAVYRLKRGNYISDDRELWKEITEQGGDAVIMGVAG